MRALLAEGAGVDVAPEVVDRLAAETGGNALALVELPARSDAPRSSAAPTRCRGG